MNKQGPNGIEWCEYTWNVLGGCLHGCEWRMPDGTTAVCYARTIAEGLAAGSYPEGFAHDYWHPERLNEPGAVKEPTTIFIDSMSDLMGRWVSDDHISQVLAVVRDHPRHRFYLLTKNAPRLLRFELPANLWAGVSMPPTAMWGHTLTHQQQFRYVQTALHVMSRLKTPIRWWSFEPLSFDVSEALLSARVGMPFEWAVIGAASRGRDYFQPAGQDIGRLEGLLNQFEIPVFYKGNLKREPVRREFPDMAQTGQLRMF